MRLRVAAGWHTPTAWWINGRRVFSSFSRNFIPPDPNAITLPVQKGRNIIAVETTRFQVPALVRVEEVTEPPAAPGARHLTLRLRRDGQLIEEQLVPVQLATALAPGR